MCPVCILRVNAAMALVVFPPPQYRCRCLIFDFSVAIPYLPQQVKRRNVASGSTKRSRWKGSWQGRNSRGAYVVNYQCVSTTDGCVFGTRQLCYLIDY